MTVVKKIRFQGRYTLGPSGAQAFAIINNNMPYTDETLVQVRTLLARVLQLGTKADALEGRSPLLGALPELDSMAVVHVLTAVEEHFGIAIADDEMSADTFATLGALAGFVEAKLAE